MNLDKKQRLCYIIFYTLFSIFLIHVILMIVSFNIYYAKASSGLFLAYIISACYLYETNGTIKIKKQWQNKRKGLPKCDTYLDNLD